MDKTAFSVLMLYWCEKDLWFELGPQHILNTHGACLPACLPAESNHQHHPHNHELDSPSVPSFCSRVEPLDVRTIWQGGPKAKTSRVGVGDKAGLLDVTHY